MDKHGLVQTWTGMQRAVLEKERTKAGQEKEHGRGPGGCGGRGQAGRRARRPHRARQVDGGPGDARRADLAVQAEVSAEPLPRTAPARLSGGARSGSASD